MIGAVPSSGRRSRVWLAAGVGLWLAAVGLGMAVVLRFADTPGDPGDPPERWPDDSLIPRARELPTLVMMAHPRCPCTRASLSELAVAMTRGQGRVMAYVLFYKPAGVDEAWWKTDLWASAAAIPGVTVRLDEEGREARRFHVATSGHTLLYDTAGMLRFSGGMTGARGHAGDNPGRGAIDDRLAQRAASRTTHFVFGCSLFDPDPASPDRRESWTR